MLIDHLNVLMEVELNCCKCDNKKNETSCDIDEFYFIDEAYKEGWRSINNNCYCPKCSKKYKIKGNKKY
ncbi:MAG: hypothetical protein PHE29_02025 [Tissierellia bacterium]|nr:hypothetical protein [Tissierellia bacterium]